ncbi:1-phosphofructokinase family hexose kinase [Aliiroseovarius sp. F20344]|uniref:1-phosphofructokinase family hexose kinase n=1 Tax=Aliiroseovarius sp. F20344 TaxID=2926414 RepID=UPI001FF6E33B|nr:1-phosphofructokinase family hexose kinase [Aliiroseovarius sp. F20344]MCK0141660.1 1-phosphofructokinase family hexose kinase [Aliiroseovarius sp. F20344]
MITQQSDILTITLNPALDLSTQMGQVRANEKLRCDTPAIDPGGGGINVARAIQRLGGYATAFVALAGLRGQQLSALLEQEGVPQLVLELPGETRISLAVTEQSAQTQYRFVMPGPEWTEEHVAKLCERLKGELREGTHVVLSGSQPPGLSPQFPSDFIKLAHAKGALVYLDTSGPAMMALQEVGSLAPDVLRLDSAESEALAGRALETIEDAVQFAQKLIESGKAHCVVLARGAEGSVLVTSDQALHAQTPPVPVQSKVGAGDSFMGGFILSCARGKSWEDALRSGVASASAAVMSPATELCRASDVARLLPEVSVTKL